MTVTVAALDAMPAREAREALASCCGAPAWLDGMETRRPFRTRDALLAAADDVWRALSPRDWMEAFAHHPRIGERHAAAAQGATAQNWSSGEQSRVAAADTTVKERLAEAQRAYEARFGHIFLICATGKSADEILAAVRARMTNDASVELRVAAEEQRKITRLRLEKLTAADSHASAPT
jgi:OHCU decarboxylase